MRILFITQFLPYPPDTGGKIKTYETLRLLAKKHQVFLISFVESRKDIKREKPLKRFCVGLKTFVTPIITTSYQQLKRKAILGLLAHKPFRVQKYFLKEAAHFIARLTQRENFAAIHCDHETSIQYLPYIKDWQRKLKIYDEHNLSSEGVLGYVAHEKSPLQKLAYFIEGEKLRLYERRQLQIFDKILAISLEDQQKLIDLGIKSEKISFFPIPFKAGKLQAKTSAKTLLFAGLLSWWPNQDAVTWFYRKAYPLVKKEVPGVKFIVVGPNLPKPIQRELKEDKSVMVTGKVKRVKDYYKKSAVFLAPIRAGAGVRVKILHALASGLPVVATKVAIAGLPLSNKKNVLLADSDSQFAQAVTLLLKNRGLAEKMAKEGIKFIEKNYNQKESLKALTWAYSNLGVSDGS